MNYIKLPFSIWKKNLSPNAIKTYCALVSFSNNATGRLTARLAVIAKRANLSISSIYRGVNELIQANLIEKYNRFLGGQYISNSYKIVKQVGNFTRVPTTSLSLDITSHSYILYLWLLKCSNKQRKAFPSLRGMYHKIGTSITTIVKHARDLSEVKIIIKTHYIKLDGSFGNNQYYMMEEILSYTFFCKKKRLTSAQNVNRSYNKTKRTICLEIYYDE